MILKKSIKIKQLQQLIQSQNQQKMKNKIEFYSAQEINQSDFQNLIDISVYILNSKGISSLINSLKLCSKLMILELSLNNCIIEEKQSEKLGLALTKMENLKFLTLLFCFSEFNDFSFIALAKELLHKKNLNSLKLQLSNTLITNQSMSYLRLNLHQFSDLKDLELNISKTQVKELDFSGLIEGIINLSLESFSLNTESTSMIAEIENKMDQGISYPVFTSLVKLKFEFEQTKLAKETFESICNFIRLAKNLKDLYLNLINNQIDSLHLFCLTESVDQKQDLHSLSLLLNKNKLKGQDFFRLFIELGKCQCLKNFNISLLENQISVQEEMQIVENLRNSLNLNMLILNIREYSIDNEDHIQNSLLRNHLRKIRNLVKFNYNFY
ncbi:hypothetical protein TTHERM_00327210 (macronuclear) [Tetrahymena thermophila SB210]|uniref:Kinase domain protein n=1 Tax=Tetrahymena thermophila (strain SB210) TaxID=312017 RepID=I7M4C9_TETTS|nr:hypothetical protein TTHERM_00327210 [Tetrahymena thermophila SB210]EAS06239.2 hypothetical protein TTHERM_00327210 [Tetrahymena thermophila SB210]|eukprot:XP_001026484.2 hypothetical protein TTHERM_00327210 [Tetrahymena thermophila SB210]